MLSRCGCGTNIIYLVMRVKLLSFSLPVMLQQLIYGVISGQLYAYAHFYFEYNWNKPDPTSINVTS